jgi:hypothetical protein
MAVYLLSMQEHLGSPHVDVLVPYARAMLSVQSAKNLQVLMDQSATVKWLMITDPLSLKRATIPPHQRFRSLLSQRTAIPIWNVETLPPRRYLVIQIHPNLSRLGEILPLSAFLP